MKNTIKELINIIDNGWDVKIYNQIKRIGGAYKVRVCWEATNAYEKIECDWYGFETTEVAINDLIKTIPLQNKTI